MKKILNSNGNLVQTTHIKNIWIFQIHTGDRGKFLKHPNELSVFRISNESVQNSLLQMKCFDQISTFPPIFSQLRYGLILSQSILHRQMHLAHWYWIKPSEVYCPPRGTVSEITWISLPSVEKFPQSRVPKGSQKFTKFKTKTKKNKQQNREKFYLHSSKDSPARDLYSLYPYAPQEFSDTLGQQLWG